jgi:hypothetical protein
VRPARAATTVSLQAAGDGSGWRTIRRVRTSAAGAFRLQVPAPAGRRWRIAWRAPDGTLQHGAPARLRGR